MEMGNVIRVFTDGVIRKVLDGDFETVMSRRSHKGNLIEEVTIQDMINHQERTEFFDHIEGRD